MSTVKSTFYVTEPDVGVAAGYFDGISDIHKFGHNGAVGATLETLWNEGGIYVYRSTAIAMKVSSDDVDDDDGDTGARTVEIEGLDADWNIIKETVTMNGQTAVNTTKLFLRVYRMKVLTAGASLWNEGIVYAGTGDITTGKPAVVHGLIEQFQNQSLMAVYPIPAGFRGFITQTFISSAVAKAVNGGLFAREEGGLFQVKEHLSTVDGIAPLMHTIADFYDEKTDLEMRARAAGGGGDVSGQFELILVEK